MNLKGLASIFGFGLAGDGLWHLQSFNKQQIPIHNL